MGCRPWSVVHASAATPTFDRFQCRSGHRSPLLRACAGTIRLSVRSPSYAGRRRHGRDAGLSKQTWMVSTLATVTVLPFAAVGIGAAVLDPNDYEPQIAQAVPVPATKQGWARYAA